MASSDAVTVEFTEKGNDLYIFFGGIKSGIAMPPFEFYNASKILDENKIFVRDLRQRWYHSGLPGISTDIPSTVAYLQRQVEAVSPRSVFCVGNSMGGFAAILFATLIGSCTAIAFAPQTFISPTLRRKHGDRRWRRAMLHTYLFSAFKARHFDLRAVIERAPSPSAVNIFVSTADPLDRVHASHLEGCKSVRVYEFATGGHEVVKVLRDAGKLPAILRGQYGTSPA